MTGLPAVRSAQRPSQQDTCCPPQPPALMSESMQAVGMYQQLAEEVFLVGLGLALIVCVALVHL